MSLIDDVKEQIEDAEAASGPAAFGLWMGAAAGVALAHDRADEFLPDALARALLDKCLRSAAETARTVDWDDADQIETERQDLLQDETFTRAFEELLGYKPVMAIDESSAYVGTVTSTDGNGEEQIESWLDATGFRRNPVAYLKYRTRDGTREYEQGSWAYRRTVDAPQQLHVRLFDGPEDASVDVYAHEEPSITQGAEHFGRPDYRTGVCTGGQGDCPGA